MRTQKVTYSRDIQFIRQESKVTFDFKASDKVSEKNVIEDSSNSSSLLQRMIRLRKSPMTQVQKKHLRFGIIFNLTGIK